jgi:subtilisin family serine protease
MAVACLASPDPASAQRVRGPVAGGGSGYHGGGWGGAGLAGFGIGVVTGIIASQPADGGTVADEPPPRGSRNAGPRQPARTSGIPPAGETRMVPDEVVIELPNTTPQRTIAAIQRRFRLTALESRRDELLGTTFYRWRIPDRRSVAAVIRALDGERRIASAQPNYLFTLQQAAESKPEAAKAEPATAAGAAATKPTEGDPAQYAVSRMHLPEAHAIAKGDNVLVAVIDSGVDASQPEVAGSIAETFDTLSTPFAPHAHGTAIAALIAGHSRLMGSAPGARILAVRAFDPAGNTAEATTFNIMKGIDWAVTHHARIVNMSFAGPADPAIHRSLAAAHRKGVVLIAAAGNAGPKSPPLYPAAEPEVIAVTATDASDKVFDGANRGRQIAIAAPGVDILIAVPNGGYEMSTGTSYSSAEVSGIAALMLQHEPQLKPDQVRAILIATARDLGKKGRDDDYGAGLIDAFRAVGDVPGERVSTATPAR